MPKATKTGLNGDLVQQTEPTSLVFPALFLYGNSTSIDHLSNSRNLRRRSRIIVGRPGVHHSDLRDRSNLISTLFLFLNAFKLYARGYVARNRRRIVADAYARIRGLFRATKADAS